MPSYRRAMTDPGSLRASDADRETVVRALTEQMTAGRLSLSELDERCRSVYAAKTYADLVPITADLPLPSPLVSPPGWVGARPGAYPVPEQSPGARPHLPTPRAGHADDAETAAPGPADAVPGRTRTDVVGRGQQHRHPSRGYGRRYPFGWRAALGGYLVTVLVLVVIWAVTTPGGDFWPGWVIGFGLLGVLRGGKHGHRRCCG